jgi:TP901 family phage tail tape measure protein
MADAQSNIKVSIDTTEALASIKNLQRQISAFHTSMAKSGAAANAVTSGMQQNLINSVNATGKFSAQMRTIKTTTESFTDSLQKNKFSMGEYFRYAGGASRSFGKLFKTEFDTINKVARENVKDLQTQYIKMGRDANGAMKAIAVRPLALDMNDLATKTMVASEKQALMNQLLKQGSTNLLNFGKNTQWAGRQLMVGFTLPLMAVGSAAAKTFMDMETQAIRFKKVYGDLFTPAEETQAALDGITELGKEFTKYGVAVSQTVGLAAEAAAAGFQGLDLQRQTAAATKLSILGQVESQKALETTISLQNAFSMSSENLAESIDFLNAVENQTVLSLDDMSTAIPKAAPVVQQLGGDVKDLAFLMTAMKEGGINASEGANALKSGLGSLINPTGRANDMLLSFGINAKKIVEDNRGNLKGTIIEFASALNQLDPLNRAQVIEQMFGKFQFARLSTLFANVTKDGTQAARVLDLAGASVQELASLSEKELGMTSESAMNKFKGAVENLKLALVPVGEEFLKAVTPIAEFVTKILDGFNNLGEGTKKIIITLTAIVAGLGPVLLMTFGLLANGIANIIKGFTFMKTLFNKTGQSSATLGTEVKYMTLEQRNAAAVAASLDQVHRTLAQTFTAEASAVDALTRAYQRSIAAQAQFVPSARPMVRGPVTKRAKGKPAVVGGTGNQDSELALLMPGETVIPTDMSKKYGSLINGMIADTIPGYANGKVSMYPEYALRLQDAAENMGQRSGTTGVANVLSPLALRMGEARGIAPTSSQINAGSFDNIYREYEGITTQFVEKLNSEYNETFANIKDENERMQRSWSSAGKHIEQQVDTIKSEAERNVARKTFGLSPDEYGTIPTDSREVGGTNPNRARRGAFRAKMTGYRSYTAIRPGAKKLFSRMTGQASDSLQMGHVYGPIQEDISKLQADPRRSGAVASAAKILARGKQDGKEYEKGMQATTRDPYDASRDRKSPHPLAAKDGRDDAIAYEKAKEKQLTQSGKKRRSASRPQGPAPIGPDMPSGATQLGIVSKPEQTRKQRLADRAKGIGGRMNSMGGGMGLLGANIGLSMLPDFAGKGLAQGALTGANLGMMFGPYGMAAGAAIGAVSTAVSSLIEKQKELKAVTEATFKGSADVATFFGNSAAAALTPISNFSREMVALSKNTKDAQSSLGLTAEEISKFSQMVEGLPEDNPLSTIVRGISNESNPAKIKETAQAFVQMQVALGQIKVEDGQKLLDLILTASGKSNMVGSLTANITTQADAIKRSIDGSASSFSTLKLTIGQVAAAAANTTSLEQLQVYLDGIAASGYNGAAGINALRQSFLDLGNVGAARVTGGLGRKGLNTSEILTVIKAQNKGMSLDGTKTGKQLLKEAQDFNKKLSETNKTGAVSTNPYKSQNESLDGQNKLLDAQIKALEKKKKLIDDQIAAQKKVTEELKRQHDFESSQADLAKKIVEAKIRGNFIEASNLEQQQINKAVEYRQEGALTPLEDKSAALQDQIDALKEKKDANSQVINSNNTNSNNTTTTSNTTNNFGTGPGKATGFGEGSFKNPLATRSLKEAYQNAPQLKPKLGGALNPGLDPSKWNQPLLGGLLGAASARSQIKKYAQSQQYLPGEFFTLDHNGLRYKFKVDDKKGNEGNIVMIGKPVPIKKEPRKAAGGLIKGPGTGTSDSIRATLGYAGGGSLRVSNGEFVVKASSVKNYGLNAMNAVNNGTATVGTNSGGTVYNINMPITSNNASAEGVANEVMRRLKVELNKNNKSNRVNI